MRAGQTGTDTDTGMGGTIMATRMGIRTVTLEATSMRTATATERDTITQGTITAMATEMRWKASTHTARTAMEHTTTDMGTATATLQTDTITRTAGLAELTVTAILAQMATIIRMEATTTPRTTTVAAAMQTQQSVATITQATTILATITGNIRTAAARITMAAKAHTSTTMAARGTTTEARGTTTAATTQATVTRTGKEAATSMGALLLKARRPALETNRPLGRVGRDTLRRKTRPQPKKRMFTSCLPSRSWKMQPLMLHCKSCTHSCKLALRNCSPPTQFIS